MGVVSDKFRYNSTLLTVFLLFFHLIREHTKHANSKFHVNLNSLSSNTFITAVIRKKNRMTPLQHQFNENSSKRTSSLFLAHSFHYYLRISFRSRRLRRALKSTIQHRTLVHNPHVCIIHHLLIIIYYHPPPSTFLYSYLSVVLLARWRGHSRKLLVTIATAL